MILLILLLPDPARKASPWMPSGGKLTLNAALLPRYAWQQGETAPASAAV